ncbi:13308_t:CDS:2, partial [Acaulospora morrowiae]
NFLYFGGEFNEPDQLTYEWPSHVTEIINGIPVNSTFDSRVNTDMTTEFLVQLGDPDDLGEDMLKPGDTIQEDIVKKTSSILERLHLLRRKEW